MPRTQALTQLHAICKPYLNITAVIIHCEASDTTCAGGPILVVDVTFGNFTISGQAMGMSYVHVSRA